MTNKDDSRNERVSYQLVPEEYAENPLYEFSMSRHVTLKAARFSLRNL